MNKNELVIGVLGGMGSFATVDFFRRLVEAFPAEKEWERPRIIIDNNCTMPSRVRAVLYGEKKDDLINLLCKSINFLIEGGANRIVLACNTSHCFLPEIRKRIPTASSLIVDIIEECALFIKHKGISEAYLMASEGTIESRIYNHTFDKHKLMISEPKQSDYAVIRNFIEVVKQNQITAEQIKSFECYLKSVNKPIILGCTELPVLFNYCNKEKLLKSIIVFDPLQCVIDKLVGSI